MSKYLGTLVQGISRVWRVWRVWSVVQSTSDEVILQRLFDRLPVRFASLTLPKHNTASLSAITITIPIFHFGLPSIPSKHPSLSLSLYSNFKIVHPNAGAPHLPTLLQLPTALRPPTTAQL